MKNVAIICGGFSSEFDISVKSGTNIQENFPDGYNSYLVLIRKTGWSILLNDNEEKFDHNSMSFFDEGVELFIDFSIIYTHGDPGENGKLQAYLDMIDAKYVNSGPLASQLSFDKWYCNQFLSGFGYKVAPSIYLNDRENVPFPKAIVEKLGLPMFIKPCDSGSSYGISKVSDQKNITIAIQEAFDEGESVIVEGFLKGTEVTCGVYKSLSGLVALPITEIVSENDFFDFEAKYKGLSQEITPARISEESRIKLQEISKEIYALMNLRSIARIDFMLVEGTPYIIEVNTTPGFSNESIVPKMISAANLTIKDFWSEILKAELN